MAESKPKARKAEADAGPASSKKPRATAKAASDNDNAAPNVPFAWKASQNNTDPFKRQEIKEEALIQGFRHAERIRNIIGPMVEQPGPGDNIPVATEMQSWITQFDELKQRNSEFRVYIAFAGVTGAGKTSAINSIIGFRDLLPSSNEQAATAVPCLITYNEDPDPATAFRAEVKFRTEDDIRKTLDQYFAAVEVHQDMMNLNKIIEEEPELGVSLQEKREKLMEHERDTARVLEDNQELMDMVSAVFGIDEAELKTEKTESLLAKHPDVARLLGQTLSVSGSDVEEFSNLIKPYMDSVPAIHGESGVEFAAWPLINEVRVFVKSAVLKNGIVLVDLHGLADNVESRATVARDYFSKLSVTAIVSPVIRARNEQTAVELMSEHQQYHLQMDGRYNKKSFCVILSKMDDIDVETYLKQHSAEANTEPALQSARESLKTMDKEFKRMEKEITKLKQTQKQKQDGRKNAKTNKQNTEDQRQALSIDQLLLANRKQAKHLTGRILHWCIKGRNTLVKKVIQQDFNRRQKILQMGASSQGHLYDGTVSIFPISSSAFWKVIRDSETPVGFPARSYTGIPALQHWLRYSAIPDRERHLDVVLNSLCGLFNTMQAWSSSSEFEGGELSLTKKFVNDEVLYRPLSRLDKELNKLFNKLAKDIGALNPIKSKDSTIANCKGRCIAEVKHWAIREPNNRLCKTLMHWNTYGACVARHGAVFQAKNHRYAWIESLCNLFYEGIVKDWNWALHEKIPALEPVTHTAIDGIWDTLMQQLGKRALITAPLIRPLLKAEEERLDHIKVLLKGMVTDQFQKIDLGAKDAHKTVTKSVQIKWEGKFKAAGKEKGQGRFERQRMLLEGFAAYRGANMFKESTDLIAEKLRNDVTAVTKQFRAITHEIRIQLRDLIMVMLKLDGQDDNAEAVVPAVTAATAAEPGAAISISSAKQDMQRATQQVILEWAAKWRIGVDSDISIRAMDTAIPEVYFDDHEEEEEDDDDSELSDLEDKDYFDFLKREEDENEEGFSLN